MNRLAAALPLALLTGCTLFGGLSEDEQRMFDQHRIGAGRYFNQGQFEKAVSQARKGLALKPDDYELQGRLAWAYLQLSLRASPDNERYLALAEERFAETMATRNPSDQDPKNVFGFAIALHNWARVEEDRARRILRDAEKLTGDEKKSRIARAEEHRRRAQHKDLAAKRHFNTVATGSFSSPANRRDAYKYLMSIEYRMGNLDQAIAMGEKSLAENAKEVEIWEQKYRTTKFTEREAIIRREFAALKDDELKVRSRLAAYHRERAIKTKSKADYSAATVHLDKILAARTNSAEDYYYRGVCHRALGHDEKARSDFKTFLSLDNHAAEHPAVQDAQQFLYGQGK